MRVENDSKLLGIPTFSGPSCKQVLLTIFTSNEEVLTEVYAMKVSEGDDDKV